MANIILLGKALNSVSVKSLINWKLCGKIGNFPTARTTITKKWYHFTKRKVVSNKNEPLSVYLKISLGVTTGIVAKMFGDHTVYCLEKGTRLVGSQSTVKEPQFNWKKLFKLLSPYWLELVGAVVAALVCALLNIHIPRALGNIVDVLSKISVESQDFFEEMKKPTFKMLIYYSLQSLFTFFYIALLANVGEGISKTMKMDMFSSVLNQDIAFFDKNRTGEILNRLTVDIQDFKSSFKMVISQGLKNITQIIGCSVSLLFISPSMTGIMMVVVPTVIMLGTFVGSLLRQLSFEAKAQAGKVTLAAEEAISNIRTVRSFAMEELEKKIVDEQAEIAKKLNVKLGYGIALFQAGTNLFLNGMVLSTIYLGGYMMTTGSISAGDLMAFLVAVQMLQRSFSQISLLFGTYIKGTHAGARVFEMIDLPAGETLKDGKIIPYHSLIPDVQFKNVEFAYPSRPTRDVLKNITLSIPEGKTVAIVGSSGGGKSTMAWLMERFYDVKGGSISIGGEDVRTLDANWLRKNVIGFISQEPVLFATTILENIRYGKPSATDQEVIKAAKLANADSFIMEFPEGYQTMVGERGVSVSGGQKQRIAIARALLKNPSILILDEATSALDAESERAVQEALDNITKTRTTIIIAHRLSTIRNADLIVVLHNGVIMEIGTHQQLLSKKGMYAALVAQQVQNN